MQWKHAEPVDSSARWPCCSTVWNPLHWWLIRTPHMHEQQEHMHLAVVAAVSGCILIHLLGAKGVISASLRCRAWSMTSSSIALCLSRVPPKSYSHGGVQKPFHVSEAWAVPLCFSSQPTKPEHCGLLAYPTTAIAVTLKPDLLSSSCFVLWARAHESGWFTGSSFCCVCLQLTQSSSTESYRCRIVIGGSGTEIRPIRWISAADTEKRESYLERVV